MKMIWTKIVTRVKLFWKKHIVDICPPEYDDIF